MHLRVWDSRVLKWANKINRKKQFCLIKEERFKNSKNHFSSTISWWAWSWLSINPISPSPPHGCLASCCYFISLESNIPFEQNNLSHADSPLFPCFLYSRFLGSPWQREFKRLFALRLYLSYSVLDIKSLVLNLESGGLCERVFTLECKICTCILVLCKWIASKFTFTGLCFCKHRHTTWILNCK